MNASISLKYAYHYVFTTVPITEINKGLYKAAVSLTHSLFNTLMALLSVAFYIVIFILKILILGFPHALRLGKIIVEFHRTQLTVYDICLEVLVLTTVLLFFLFRSRIAKAWKDVEAYISKKSTAAAKAAPHILFFGSSLVLTVVGKKFIMPLTSNSVMPLFTLIIPLFTTLRLLYGAHGTKNLYEVFNHKILLWVILAAYHAIVTVLSLIPFSTRLLYLLPIGKELVIVVLLWVQLSPAFADIVFKSVVTPILKKISVYLPTTDSFESKVQQSNMLVRGLKMMRLITDAQEDFLRSLLQDSVASLMALCFLFTPNPFASVGMVAVALLLPAFRTASISSALIQAKLTLRSLENSKTGGKNADGKQQLPTLMAVHRQWLDYWVCIGLLWCIRIYGVTVWPSVMMVSSLYLQHSYFRGASTALKWITVNGRMLVDRNAETQRQRLLEQQQQQAGKSVSEEQLYEDQALDSTLSEALSSGASTTSSASASLRTKNSHDSATTSVSAAAEAKPSSEGRKDYKELKLRLAAASVATTSRVSGSKSASTSTTAAVSGVPPAAEESGPFSAASKQSEVSPEEEYVKVQPPSTSAKSAAANIDDASALLNEEPAEEKVVHKKDD